VETGVKVKRIKITFRIFLFEIEIELSKESIKKAFAKVAALRKRINQRLKKR